MHKFGLTLIGATSLLAFNAAAQTGQSAPAPQVAMIGASTETVLRAGTPVALKMSEGLTTEGKKLRAGQRFQMEVTEPVMLGNAVVIPVGSPATGEITDVRNKGMWGKSGRIGAQVLFVRVNGRQLRLTGSFDDKGVTGTAGVVGAAVLVPLAGFFVTGTSAKLPVGAAVKAFLDEDVPVTFAAAAAPQPLVIQPAASTAPVAVAPKN